MLRHADVKTPVFIRTNDLDSFGYPSILNVCRVYSSRRSVCYGKTSACQYLRKRGRGRDARARPPGDAR